MEKIKPYLIALGLGMIFTILLTWPLTPNITSYYSDQGDYPIAGSMLWYNTQSLISGKIFNQKEYLKGYQFYGQPYSAVFINHSIIPSLIFAPIYAVTGSLPFSVNLYAMLTLILSFMAAFYVCFFFTENLWASLVGAFIFTFNPPTMVRFPHHLDILGKYFLPLVFLFGYRFFYTPTVKYSLLFALFFTLNALSVNYYLIFSLVIIPILFLPFLIAGLRSKDWRYFGRLGTFGLLGLVFLPVLLYFILPYSQFSQKEGATRPIEATPFFSARINDYFAASPDSLIYGGWVKSMEPFRGPKDDRGILNYEEHTLFVGLVALILLFIGLKEFFGSRSVGRSNKFGMTGAGKWYFGLLLVIPFALSFGPYFPPYYYLYKIVPFLMEGIRSPSRFEFLLLLPLSIFASFGAMWVMKKVGDTRGIWVIGIIGVILILENFTVKNFDSRSAVLDQLGQMSQDLKFLEGKVTLHLPVYGLEDADEFGKNSAYLNWLTQTGEKIFNGNSAYLPPDQLGLLDKFRAEGLNEENIKMLKLLGVSFIVIHKDIDVEILDMAKFNVEAKSCSLDKDFDIRSGEDFLILQNKSDCFLVSRFSDRYRQKDGLFFRLPLLIGPKEQVILDQ